MRTSSNLYEHQRRRIHSLIAITAAAVIVVGGIGIKELRSILSTSKAESAATFSATSAAPLFDTHIVNPLSGLKLNAEPVHGLAVVPHLGVSGAR
jgi:hypothetical protein